MTTIINLAVEYLKMKLSVALMGGLFIGSLFMGAIIWGIVLTIRDGIKDWKQRHKKMQ